MSEGKISYFAVIPANVRYDEDLPPNAKLLYGEITALCNEKGFCWASNKYFADLYKVSKVSVSNWVSKLVEKGYIISEIQYKGGSKEILGRYIKILNDPIKENFDTPIKEIFKDNNTLFNNTDNSNIPPISPTEDGGEIPDETPLEETSKERKKVAPKKEIPALEEFVRYGLTNITGLTEESKSHYTDLIEKKYAAWVENGWRNGNDKPIKRWKSNLLNAIPHLKPFYRSQISVGIPKKSKFETNMETFSELIMPE